MNKIYGVRAPNFGLGAFDVWVLFHSFENAIFCYPNRKIYRLPASKLKGYVNK